LYSEGKFLKYLFTLASSDSKKFYDENTRQARECTTEFTTPDKLVAKPGDLIEFQRAVGIYSHWGVYIGEGEVIHWTGKYIRVDKVEKASKNYHCRVNNLESAAAKRGLKIKDKDSVETAAYKYLDQFEKGNFEYQYSITGFNCEHFATLCAYDFAFSEQANIVGNKTFLPYFSYYLFDSSVIRMDSQVTENEINSSRMCYYNKYTFN
jgi:hypothetical protein